MNSDGDIDLGLLHEEAWNARRAGTTNIIILPIFHTLLEKQDPITQNLWHKCLYMPLSGHIKRRNEMN